METEVEFNDLLNALLIGDQVMLEVMRVGKLRQINVDVASYDWPDVKLRPTAAASQRQQMILAHWQASQS